MGGDLSGRAVERDIFWRELPSPFELKEGFYGHGLGEKLKEKEEKKKGKRQERSEWEGFLIRGESLLAERPLRLRWGNLLGLTFQHLGSPFLQSHHASY